jgi:hypothetical protein
VILSITLHNKFSIDWNNEYCSFRLWPPFAPISVPLEVTLTFSFRFLRCENNIWPSWRIVVTLSRRCLWWSAILSVVWTSSPIHVHVWWWCNYLATNIFFFLWINGNTTHIIKIRTPQSNYWYIGRSIEHFQNLNALMLQLAYNFAPLRTFAFQKEIVMVQ